MQQIAVYFALRVAWPGLGGARVRAGGFQGGGFGVFKTYYFAKSSRWFKAHKTTLPPAPLPSERRAFAPLSIGEGLGVRFCAIAVHRQFNL